MVNEMTRTANERLSRSKGRRTKLFLLIASMILVLSLFGSCSAGGEADESELRITDSGFIVQDENWFSYYVIVENLTDKPLNDATVKMAAYDENGEEIQMKDANKAPTIAKMHAGELSIGYIAPGGKGIYANEVNINQAFADCEKIPSGMEFSLTGPKWAKEEKRDSLEVVDFTELGYYYDSERSYWADDSSEEPVYDGSETREECSVTIKNTGDEDFVMTDAHGFDVFVVQRDGDGNVVAAGRAGLSTQSGMPDEMTIPAGEEVCFDLSDMPYVPHDSVEFFVTYYSFEG